MMTAVMTMACGDGRTLPPIPPTPPPPTDGLVTANAYILDGATNRGAGAFGSSPVVLYKGERLRWVNLDTAAHSLAADSPSTGDFVKTELLQPGGEQTFMMQTLGTTSFHCTIHPAMTGVLVVRQR